MKSISILLSAYVKNDSRVLRTIDALRGNFKIILFSKDESFDIVEQHVFHRRYSYSDRVFFESDSMPILKLLKKLSYYIDTERIKFISVFAHDADIIYCNDFKTLLTGYIVSRKKRAKLVYDSHELWSERSGASNTLFNRMKRLLEYMLEYFLIRRCDQVITVSEGIACELAHRYQIDLPVVIRNLDETNELSTEESRAEVRHTIGIPEDSLLIVYQGALTEDRGIPELVDAMNMLPHNFHLLLMGGEPDKDLLDKILSNSRIHYPGLIPLKLLYKYTSAADIGIAPIKTSGLKSYSLTFPNKFSQYMNAGLALCLYDIKESRNIFEKCGCGVTIPEITPESIRSSIMSLIENYDLKKLQKLSRDCFIQYYNWNAERETLVDTMIDVADTGERK